MPILTSSRDPLDAVLEDPNAIVLILVGSRESRAAKLYDAIASFDWEGWHHCFLVTDGSILGAEFADCATSGRYAVLGGEPKRVAAVGPIDDLFARGQVSPLRLREVFAVGDLE